MPNQVPPPASRLLPIHAYGFAATFKLKDLRAAFEALGPAQLEKDRLLVGVGGERFALAFDFGAVVFVGVDDEVRKRTIELVLSCLPPEPNPPITENFLVEVAEVAAPEVRFDRVIVREVTVPVIDVVAEMIAQSVSMDYYAKDVDEIEVRFDQIVAQLRSSAKTPQVGELTRFIGLCIATRNDVISTLALFDKPDDTWENEQLDRLWVALRHMLELDDRYRGLEAKLRLFQENLVVLVDLARQRHTLLLEWAVVFLIAVELVIMLWQVLSAAGHG
jgi:uncharacterized Rmd1/YagE family protein